MSKPRILIMDTGSRFNKFGGQQRIAWALHNGLSKDFEAYYLGYPTRHIRPGGKAIMIDSGTKSIGTGARRSRVSENAFVRIGYNIVFNRFMVGTDRRRIAREVREIGPDIIISNAISDFSLLRYLRRNGIKFKAVYIDHGSLSTSVASYFSKEGVPLTFGTGISSTSLSGAKRRFFGFFDVNVALSRNQEKAMRRFTDKAVCIPNGLDIDAKVPEPARSAARRRYGIGKGNFVVLYVGRLFERQKSVSTLISAFRMLGDPRFRLLIVGAGPSRGEYASLSRGDNRIRFAGELDRGGTRAAYSIADLFVLPSHWEGFPLTVIEAASFSLPLILSNGAYIDDLRDATDDRIPSFDAGDAEKLSKLLERMYRSERSRSAASKLSKAIAKEFTEKRMLASYAVLLKGLIGNRVVLRAVGQPATRGEGAWKRINLQPGQLQKS